MRTCGSIRAVLATGLEALLLIGCAELPFHGSAAIDSGTTSEQNEQIAGYPDSHGHVAHVVVPFFPDDTDQCGPATLASLLTYWGIPSDPPSLKGQTYTSRLRGTLPMDLLLAAQARGLQASGSNGTLETLKVELDADRPVVALLNLGWTIFPQGHYVVITGYDERRQGVYMHSGLARDLFVPYEQFLANWSKTGRWMLRVQPMERRVNVYESTDGRQ
jgi:ABC-type bacteriocin/lantibiotic exporter with double-glycine peptidase domain